jgi:hypothetical protein
VPYIPPDVGHWGAIWAVVCDARKDGQREVCKSKKSNGNGDNDGHRLVDREEEYHQANEKKEHGEVEECWGRLNCMKHAHVVLLHAAKQIRTDPRLLSL